ncbi:hypothetical protein [Mycobacterium asiaticum]|uniref:Uncharacterized protein n=1 Tax=Mycobacterium asiaticum TaxID=1790 RepID=A0A1A3MX90_MYCAS|nr:hypothetical protein [Mycobacterium asiaticum]OBK13700.1 hypothetical protein A5636_01725 [Mycobacterium asiaticum]
MNDVEGTLLPISEGADEGTVEAQVAWPTDLYREAGVSNIFVLSDDGQGLYLALGHIPPFAGKPSPKITVTPNVRGSVYLTYKNAGELGELLTAAYQRKKQEVERQRQQGEAK